MSKLTDILLDTKTSDGGHSEATVATRYPQVQVWDT